MLTPDLDAPRQLLLILTLLAPLIVAESWIGHHRSGFHLRVQWSPIATGAALTLACAAAAIRPDAPWPVIALRGTGWLAVGVGAVGVAYHHRHGMATRAGGYRWWRHWLMYGAPQLAPLALSALGAVAVVVAHRLAGHVSIGETHVRRVVLALVAVAITGALLQTAVLHYRGAFNTPAMYGPFVAPPAAVLATAALAMTGTSASWLELAARGALWLTVLTGFVGLGMHLRGLDRQMGGLRLLEFNVLQGPPPFAPAIFSGLGAMGLVALRMT